MPGYDEGQGAMTTELTPVKARAHDAAFVTQCSLQALQDRLPLRWPTPPDTSPSPKRAYRSHYLYLGWQDLLYPTAWEHLSDFDLTLRLVDFAPLRPVLAQHLGWTSARGWIPFDPVSIFLLIGWQIINHWTRAQTLRHLRDPRYADYARRFGFQRGIFPTEGGLRHWLTALGRHCTHGDTILIDEDRSIEIAIQHLNHLLAQSVTLILQANLLSVDAWAKALICPDGMIHDAASRMRCASVQDSCYQPTSPDAPRPCPAKEKDRRGCNCQSTACAQACRHATPREPQARFVCYSGSNQTPDNPNQSTDPTLVKNSSGEAHYGYRSLPIQLADPTRRFSLVLLDDVLSANQREENPGAALLLQLATFYPGLQVHTVAGDAAFGYDITLHVVYAHLHAQRVIDLRAHHTDRNKALWPVRGYDDKGRPICPFGYSLKANGFDVDRHRHKWACFQACRQQATPRVLVKGVTYSPDQCPYLAVHHPHGRIINVSERFKDRSIRLVRDLPVGTPAWKRIYHRARNAVEGRNAAFTRWGLKRLPVYGTPRAKALIFQADAWLNLTTLARLVREATMAAGFT